MTFGATTSFGALLRAHRLAAGLTEEDLAVWAGVSAEKIRVLENSTQAPLKYTLQRLARALALRGEERAAFVAAGIPRPPVRRDGGPQLAPGAPPGGSAPHRTGPAPPTSFVGRQQDTQDVLYLLRQAHLLTLTGPAGVGKTRLALQVVAVAAAAEHDPGRAYVVELAPVADPALVPQAVATALDLRLPEDRPSLDTLVDQLRSRALLLVLDNCDHLLGACAALVEQVVAWCPHVHVLATSRECLVLAGEVVFSVEPLAVPPLDPLPPLEELGAVEAVQLFVDRVRTIQFDFALTPANALAVAQICVRLAGLPLALELAAARVRGLGVDRLASHLDQHFALQGGAQHAALPHPETLRSVVAWSYQRIAPLERTLWARLAVFAGRYTREAAEAVGADDALPRARVPDLLARLVDKSLVQVAIAGEEARYSLLKPLRRDAEERLAESGERAAVQDRHAAYYLALAERAAAHYRGPEEGAWLRVLDAELDNLRAALAWLLAAPAPDEDDQVVRARGERGLRLATELRVFWITRPHKREGLRWLEQALARVGSAPLLSARALSAAGWLAWTMGDARRHHLLLQAAALFRELGAMAELADALNLAGLSIRGMWSDELRDPSAYDEGAAYLEESLALARQTGEPFAIAVAAANMATTVDLRRDEDRRRARALAEEALAVFTARQSSWGIGMAEQVIGAVAAYEGDFARAATGFATHLDVRRAAGAVPGVAYGLLLQGELALAMGDTAQATVYLEESLATYQTMNIDRRRMARVARLLGEIALGRGLFGEARQHFATSLRAAQEGGTLASVAGSLEGLAGGVASAGQAERALRLAGAAHRLREATAQPLSEDGEARLERWLAPARALLSQSEQAALWTAGRALTPEQAIATALPTLLG